MFIQTSRTSMSGRFVSHLVRTRRGNRSFFSLADGGGRDCSWKPSLLHHRDVDRILPWGFVDQANVFEKVMPSLSRQLCASQQNGRPFHEGLLKELRSWVQKKTSDARAGRKYFQLAGTSHSEFSEGAKVAYQHIAKLWSSGEHLDDIDQVENLMTPALAELFGQVHATWRDKHKLHPKIVLSSQQPILASVIKCEMEEGRAHKPGQIFDRWDQDDFWTQLLIGAAGPEAQLMQRRHSIMMGSDPHAHIPRRLVAHTLFLVEEKYEYRNHIACIEDTIRGIKERGSDEHTATGNEFCWKAHVWEFESDFGVSLHSGQEMKLQWRVRNINDAIKPRAGHVLQSDGIVERHFGRWMY